jgi:hypothetical protein
VALLDSDEDFTMTELGTGAAVGDPSTYESFGKRLSELLPENQAFGVRAAMLRRRGDWPESDPPEGFASE